MGITHMLAASVVNRVETWYIQSSSVHSRSGLPIDRMSTTAIREGSYHLNTTI